MIALIDGDILVYRIGFSTEDVNEGIARSRCTEYLESIVRAIGADEFRVYLTSTDRSNFRFQLYPEYKGNRKQPKPKHYDAIRNYLVEKFGATVCYGAEADDAIGIAQSSSGNLDESIICTIDKDLDQIEGWHYNFVRERKYYIKELEGYRCFYTQCLTGDRTDNIPGIRGIGPVTAERMLEGCENEKQMLSCVVKQYGEGRLDDLLLNGNLLWIRRKPDQVWELNGSPVSKETLENFLPLPELTSSMRAVSTNISSLNKNDPTSKTSESEM